MKQLILSTLLLMALSGTANAVDVETNTLWNSYGAIAYSPSTGRWGTANNQWDVFSAEATAVGFCAVADCRSVVWVTNGCAAVSRSTSGGNGWAIAYSRWQAEANAQTQCQIRNGFTCSPLAWVCTSGW